MPGKVGKGRRYRSPSRIRVLKRIVERALARGEQPTPKILDELSQALEYAGRSRSQIVALLLKWGRKPPKGSWTGNISRKTATQVEAVDFGLRPVISFDSEDGDPLMDSLRIVWAKHTSMPSGTKIESVLSSLPKRQRARLSWAVVILQQLGKLNIEPEKVRAVHVSEKEAGGFVFVGVKRSGMTFRGEFGE